MKKAAVINDIRKLKGIVDKYDVIGIGSEFCHNITLKFFSEINDELEKILRWKKIIIYTPILTDLIFDTFVDKLKQIILKFKNFEIMVTDLGLLDWLNSNFPYIKKGIARPLSIDFVRMNLKILNRFIKDLRIHSIETDEINFLYKFKNRSFKIYFRVPLKYVGLSRFCPYERKIIYSCNYQCFNYYDEIKIKDSNEKIIIFENCYFKKIKGYKNLYNKNLDVDMIVETIYRQIN